MRTRSFSVGVLVVAALTGCQKESPRATQSEEPARPSLSASAPVESAHVETPIASSSAAPVAEPSDGKIDQADLLRKLQSVPLGKEVEVSKDIFMAVFQANATKPIAGGWNLAESKRGGFSVEIPIPFNELETRGKATDGVELTSIVIGGKTKGLLSWSASCMARRDGKLKDVTLHDHIEPLGTPVQAWKRELPFPDRVCFAIVEAQGSDPLPSAADRNRFLSSLKKTGAFTF